MKVIGLMFLMVGLFIPQMTQAQGTVTYLSNLGQTSTGSEAVGSNSWLTAGFETGNNADGYNLNSVQLAMTDASGTPSGFTVMLYSVRLGAFGQPNSPRTNIDTLTGSTNPSTAGIYTYTDDSNLILSPNTDYYIVLTAGTAVANGAYGWSYANTSSYSPVDGWTTGGEPYESSTNGVSLWRESVGIYPQYAITATAIPEPSPSWLLLLGSSMFIYVCRLHGKKSA